MMDADLNCATHLTGSEVEDEGFCVPLRVRERLGNIWGTGTGTRSRTRVPVPVPRQPIGLGSMGLPRKKKRLFSLSHQSVITIF